MRLLKQRNKYLRDDVPADIRLCIQGVPFQVYGLPDFQQGLQLTTWSCGIIGEAYQGIGFDYYRSWEASLNEEKVILSIGSTNWNMAQFQRDEVKDDLLSWMPFTDEEKRRGEHLIAEPTTITIEETTFEGTLWSLPDLYQLTKIYLRTGDTILYGKSMGLPLENVHSLLSRLVVLNNREDLLTQYQAEMNHRLEQQKEDYRRKKN
jgi:hypothetical protein